MKLLSELPKSPLSLAILALSAIGVYFLVSNISGEPTPEELDEITVTETKAEIEQLVIAQTKDIEALPDTLLGAQPVRPLAIDEDGNLRLSSDIKETFDFYLSAIEEEGLDIVLERIRSHLRNTLQQPALSQAMDILDSYIGYKRSLMDFETEQAGIASELFEQKKQGLEVDYLGYLEQQLDARSQLRQASLDPEIFDAFFSGEEEFDRYNLQKMQIMSDDSLSPEQKQVALEQLQGTVPENFYIADQEELAREELTKRVEDIREQGGSDQDVFDARAEAYGEEAAQRFAELDAERAAWQNRVDEFMTKRQDILDNSGLSEQEALLEVETLRNSSFDDRERIRVQVYERQSNLEAQG